MTEKENRKLVTEFLAKTGAWFYYVHQHGYRAFKGIPDIAGSFHRKHFFLEIKSSDGRVRKEQQDFLLRAEAEGFHWFIVRDFDQFLSWWKREMGNLLY